MLNQRQTTLDNIAKFNKVNPLADFLLPFIGDKKEVLIADIGSGPFVTIGQYLDGVNVVVYPCDNQDFSGFYKKYNVTPLYKIQYQDMENLAIEDNFFDIVNCDNAVDHTKDALKAVNEMIRICKPGGIIRINYCLDQMDTGHKHFWNGKESGAFVNKEGYGFNLMALGFKIEYQPNELERRYHKVIAIKQK